MKTQLLLLLGADDIISLKQDDELFIAQLKEIHNNTPVNIVIDYLWGHPAELILSSFTACLLFPNQLNLLAELLCYWSEQ